MRHQEIKGIENIQPFLYHFYDMSVAICHNGNLINAQTLRQYLENMAPFFTHLLIRSDYAFNSS